MMNKYMHGWIGGKYVYYVDFIGISSLMGLGVKDFTVGRAALKAASSKIAKHEKTCYDNQHRFYTIFIRHFWFFSTRDCKSFEKNLKGHA
jgi:hypothetical protein